MNDTAPTGGEPTGEPGGQGDPQNDNWYGSASEEVQGYIQNKGWDDPLKAVASYQELEKYRGASEDELIKIPKDGESWDEVYTKLGRPEEAKGYEWSAPEGVPVDNTRLEAFQNKAYELGLSKDQFTALVNLDAEYSMNFQNNALETLQQKQATELEALKQEWGEGFDERVEIGRRFISTNFPEGVDKELTLNLIEEAIGTSTMLKLFANAGVKANNQEGKLPDSGGDRPYGYTKEQAAADMAALKNEIAADPKRLDTYNKGIGNDYEKMQRLNKLASG